MVFSVVIEFLLDELGYEDVTAILYDAQMRLPSDEHIQVLCKIFKIKEPIPIHLR